MFTTSQKIDCLRKIEEGITIPNKNYFVKNDTSIRLCYFMGKTIKYINLPTPEDVAGFLKKHGVIKFYAVKEDALNMYTTTLITIAGDKGQPVQQERPVVLKWCDIDISAAHVLHYAACEEFEISGGVMGFVKRRVFSTTGYRAA